MPDTSPQRLEQIKRCARNGAYGYGRDAVTDLLAMIDALDAQVRELTKPEEDVRADPCCLTCSGRGYTLWGEVTHSSTRPMDHCPNCDPKGLIPLPTLSGQ